MVPTNLQDALGLSRPQKQFPYLPEYPGHLRFRNQEWFQRFPVSSTLLKLWLVALLVLLLMPLRSDFLKQHQEMTRTTARRPLTRKFI